MKGFTKKQELVWVTMHGLGSVKEVAAYLGMKKTLVASALANCDKKITQAVVEQWEDNPYSKFTGARSKTMPLPPRMRYSDD